MNRILKRIIPATLVGACAIAGSAHAANHALIMTIGNYSNPRANLPGIALDAANAARIAAAMGVPESNIAFLSDQQLTVAGIAEALDRLARRIGQGDNVFLYYSGHGAQRPAAGGQGKCSEGMVAYDMALYQDNSLIPALGAISAKAGQLVVMNDSCFSGGAAQTKDIAADGDRAPKVYKFSQAGGNYRCGQAINMKITRDMLPVAAKGGANMLYIAAAADNEVASATSKGSAATLAWTQCLKPSSDRNGSSALSGADLQVCAQRYLDANHFDHHITLIGNDKLPLALAGTRPSGLAAAQTSGGTAVNPAAALEALRNAASPARRVTMKAASHRMKIRTDPLDFEVVTSHAGYLSVFQVGSDGETFNLLYPNEIDNDNHVEAGTIKLPRPGWRLKAGGPKGNSYLLAIISDSPRDFRKVLRKASDSPFYYADITADSFRNLFVAATGAEESGTGRYGASEVIRIEEY